MPRNRVQGGPKIGTPFLYALTLPNINRFSKLFHCENQPQEKLCNNTITKDPITPRVCRYSTIRKLDDMVASLRQFEDSYFTMPIRVAARWAIRVFQ